MKKSHSVLTLQILVLSLSSILSVLASDLPELYSKPIPVSSNIGKGIGGAEAESISNDASNEPLVKLSDHGIAGEAFYARKDGLNAPYNKCVCSGDGVLKSRESIAKKLKRVNERLAKLDLELYILDAYRPVSCQQELWKYFIGDAKRILGDDASETALADYASRFCSHPSKYNDHQTGGAVDLTIRRKATGELLYMGSIFDEDSELCFTAHFEIQNSSEKTKSNNRKKERQVATASDIEAMRNRRLLYWVMTEEGFLNYRHEWWHFDYGTLPWAKNEGTKTDRKAFYGII